MITSAGVPAETSGYVPLLDAGVSAETSRGTPVPELWTPAWALAMQETRHASNDQPQASAGTPGGYFTATGTTGEPQAATNGSGAAISRNA
jgi:hypothetical protein